MDTLALPRHLLTRFGPLGSLAILGELAMRLARGEPFASLPPATTRAERDSRRQAAPAFVLYRVLTRRGVADPFEETAAIIELAGVHFLRKALGPLDPKTFAAMDGPARDRWVARLAAGFPNAEPDFEEVSARRVRFRVHHCRFVTLAHQIGEPRLATLFCRADESYFGKVERNVDLVRPHTLARGGPDCPFELRFVGSPDGESRGRPS